MTSRSLFARFTFASSGFALGLVVLAASPACSSSDSGSSIPAADTCGNGRLDPGESCDTAIASGGSACASSCDDGDACTADTLTGEACTASCEHAPVTACRSGDGCCPKGCSVAKDADCKVVCGDGVVGPGEDCDVAIKSGAGACPKSCTSADACAAPRLEGSGCNARCVVTTTTSPKSGDGCCPAGATHATDSDCPAAYGDPCTTAAQCQTGLCLTDVMCTKNCTFAGPVNQCGVPGHFCFHASAGQDVCYPLTKTGIDSDDRYVGPGVPYNARMDFANDEDAFVADLAIGVYTLTVTPTDAAPQIDLVVDIYDGGATKVGMLNAQGVGQPEAGEYTAGAAGRSVFVVRSANALQGNYSIRLDKKS